jgi:hypothetical protein
MALKMACQELTMTQEQLEATSQQNQQLQAQLSHLAVRDGDRVGKVKYVKASWPHFTILDDLSKHPRNHSGISQCLTHPN